MTENISMKKMITARLLSVTLVAVFVILVINTAMQINNIRWNYIRGARLKTDQLEEMLATNDANLSVLKESQREAGIDRAKAAAYIVQHNPRIVDNLPEMEKVASLLQVDELHIINDRGEIYSGTMPQYYGLSFDSGEQIRFFQPLLNDRSLVLSQDIVPNTAENKLMQYSGVWQEDGKNIIQVGIEPRKILAHQKLMELPYLFSILSYNEGEIQLAVDKATGLIAGCTDTDLTGKPAVEVGFRTVEKMSDDGGFSAKIKGKRYFCYFEDTGDLLLGVVTDKKILYENLYSHIPVVAVYLLFIMLVLLYAVYFFIDRYILRGINEVIENLSLIAAGNLDLIVDVVSLPELKKLSDHINSMVHSLLNNTDKLSKIFDMANVMIGVYEYNSDMKRVRATRKVQTLLMLDDRAFAEITADKKRFLEYMDGIFSQPYDRDRHIYRVSTNPVSYLEIMPFADERNTVCIVSDVTERILEKQKIEHDRDYDVLTGLLNRRGFANAVEKLKENGLATKNITVLFVDMDDLKRINDTYGHANGDIAIKVAAQMLDGGQTDHRITARIGGDEFVVLLYGYESPEAEEIIRSVYRRLLNTTATLTDGTVIPVGLSGGYASHSGDGFDCDALTKAADAALYEAKQGGKGIFKAYEKSPEKLL